MMWASSLLPPVYTSVVQFAAWISLLSFLSLTVLRSKEVVRLGWIWMDDLQGESLCSLLLIRPSNHPLLWTKILFHGHGLQTLIYKMTLTKSLPEGSIKKSVIAWLLGHGTWNTKSDSLVPQLFPGSPLFSLTGKIMTLLCKKCFKNQCWLIKVISRSCTKEYSILNSFPLLNCLRISEWWYRNMNVLLIQSWTSLSSLIAKAPHWSPTHLQFTAGSGHLTRTIRICWSYFSCRHL